MKLNEIKERLWKIKLILDEIAKTTKEPQVQRFLEANLRLSEFERKELSVIGKAINARRRKKAWRKRRQVQNLCEDNISVCSEWQQYWLNAQQNYYKNEAIYIRLKRSRRKLKKRLSKLKTNSTEYESTNAELRNVEHDMFHIFPKPQPLDATTRFYKTELDARRFLENRKEWDSYISSTGTAIPSGWVIP